MADTSNPSLVDHPAVQRLKDEAQGYLAARAQRALMSAGEKLGRATGRLDDIAEGRSPGLAKAALATGRKVAEGKNPVRGALEAGASHVKDNVTQALKGLGKKKSKGGGGKKPVVIIESVDVGVPVREAYDQWTRYQDFSTFAHGVKSASAADDTTSDWQVKVFWSSRSWQARTTEQIPDTRIQWTSDGAKGSTKGVVTFHSLGDTLTRVLLVVEYYPQGLFERTGNIWRAQGRRVRLDLKNFARHISLRGTAEDGWRGEIRDGEVVLSHDDAVADEEERAADARDEDWADGSGDGPVEYEDEDESQDASGDAADYEDDDEADVEYEDEPADPEDEAEDAEDGGYEDEAEVEDEPAAEEEGYEDDGYEDETNADADTRERR
ncbi:SRPBCC family protein [Streptomyces sp. NPDC020965]|uniref:SRPBCC family protein n=1 Tax=Streptomyces sp. NPDC020965 TaxID=3365105 RepID=UPI0037B0726A